jgi:Mrp family chromosome partitioning ATPase
MGRTYEALSQHRIKRERDAEEASAPATVYAPVFPTPTTALKPADLLPPEVASDFTTADTALADDLGRDHHDVPFIEVGGPRGSKPILSPEVAAFLSDTKIQNPQPLKLEPTPIAPATTPVPLSITFFPLPDRPPLNVDQVARELIALRQPDHAASAQYRGILAGIAAQHPGAGCPLLVFTTTNRETDAASIVLNLAITRARETNKRLLVIEANHEHPMVADQLGIASRPGMRELLNRAVPLAVALHPTAQPFLYALPPGDPEIPVSHEAEARLPDLVKQLRDRFDWLLVNGPNWGAEGASDWLGLGDAAYMIVRHDHWDGAEVEKAHQHITSAGIRLRGYVTLKN